MKLLKWFRACRKISYRLFSGFRLVSVAVISRSRFGTNSGFIVQYRNFEICKKHFLTSAEYAQHVCDQLLFRESFFFLHEYTFWEYWGRYFPNLNWRCWERTRDCDFFRICFSVSRWWSVKFIKVEKTSEGYPFFF